MWFGPQEWCQYGGDVGQVLIGQTIISLTRPSLFSSGQWCPFQPLSSDSGMPCLRSSLFCSARSCSISLNWAHSSSMSSSLNSVTRSAGCFQILDRYPGRLWSLCWHRLTLFLFFQLVGWSLSRCGRFLKSFSCSSLSSAVSSSSVWFSSALLKTLKVHGCFFAGFCRLLRKFQAWTNSSPDSSCWFCCHWCSIPY